MSLKYGDYTKTQKRAGVIRPPTMTLSEFSRKTGQPYSTLRRQFAKSGQGVATAFTITVKGHLRTYYPLPDLERWYSANKNRNNKEQHP